MIYEKLQQARVKLQQTKLNKSGKNTYADFKYFELADFLPQINKIFLDLKLFSRFTLNETSAELEIIDWEEKDENKNRVSFNSPITEIEISKGNKIQAIGAVHTYIKRYLYLNALEICENDPLDKTLGKENKKAEPKKIVPKTEKHSELTARQQLYSLLKSKGFTNDEMNRFCKIHNIVPENTTEFLKRDDVDICIYDYLKEIKKGE